MSCKNISSIIGFAQTFFSAFFFFDKGLVCFFDKTNGRMNLIKTLFPYVLCSTTLNAIETISSAK